MAKGFWFTSQGKRKRISPQIPSVHSMFMRESRTVLTEEREFHDKPQNYLCSLERDSLGHHLILLVFPALLAKPQR